MFNQDKKSFISRAPFEKHKAYLLWLKLSGSLIFILIMILAYKFFCGYQNYQNLLINKSSLLASVSKFDELVRKKNKLLNLDAGQAKHSKKNYEIHAKIADYLKQIEKTLTYGVQLNSFEYTAKKIEITGYSRDITNLSGTIEKLDKLDFVKSHELEQISNSGKELGNKLAFTIVLNL